MRKLLLFGLCMAFFLAAGTVDAWWDSSWNYYKTISVQNTNATDAAPIQTATFTMDTQTLISAGKMQSDCDDLRILLNDTTELDRYIEGCNTATTNISFKLSESIPASTTSTNYSVYYGNAGAGAGESNWTNIFMQPVDENTIVSLWFEEASGAIYDHTPNSVDWSVSGNPTYQAANGLVGYSMDFDGSGDYIDNSTDFPDLVALNTAGSIEFGVYQDAKSGTDYIYNFGNDTSSYVYALVNPDGGTKLRLVCGGLGADTAVGVFNSATLYNITITWDSTSCTLYVNGVSKATVSTVSHSWDTLNDWTIGRYLGASGYEFSGKIDEFRISNTARTVNSYERDWRDTEFKPVLGTSLGSEQANDVTPLITISSPANTTYYTTIIDFNFSVSDGEDATFHVIAYNDTDAIYDSVAYANNTNMSFTLSETGGQQNVTVWANDSAGNEATSTILYYVWMGLNVSAYNNATNASMTDWAITATNGTFTYTNDSQNNPSLIEWNLLPTGSVNITIDDNSTTLYFYNTTYERTLNDSAIVQLDAYLQPKSENPIVLSSSAGWSMLQGQSTTITCTASEATPEFKVNSVLVASPYTLTVQTGQYVAACNVYNETENYAPKNTSNIIVVNPLISCTSNETFAYSATITTSTNLTTLDFTTFAGQNLVRSNLGDVYVPLSNNTWINTTGGSYVIVNNTGQSSFTVYFGNYYANKSYNTSSLQGDQKNITTYTHINPSIMYNILDELTGEYMFPPNATLTSIIHCSLGETYIQIDEGDTRILIASSAYLDKASLRVLYTADAYYSRQLYPEESDALVLSFYVVDALQNALDRIDFLMEDINYYSTKLQVYKTVQTEALIITEGYFDASHYFSVYLMEDSDYYMRTIGSTGAVTDFGRITIVAPATKTLGQVTMNLNPQATLISDNILMNAWTNTDRTALYIVYTDATNETTNVTITVYFANGTVFENATYSAQAVNVEYNISNYTNESFTVAFSVWHETFGNSPVTYTVGVFPGIAWDIGVNTTLYTLYSLVLLILVGGVATRQSIVAGSVLFLVTMIMLYQIGWLSISLVSIAFIGVLLVLGIIVSGKQQEGT